MFRKVTAFPSGKESVNGDITQSNNWDQPVFLTLDDLVSTLEDPAVNSQLRENMGSHTTLAQHQGRQLDVSCFYKMTTCTAVSGPLDMSLADFLIDAANNGDDITVVVDEDSEVDPYYTSQTIAASMGSVPGSGKTTFKWQLSWVYAAVSNSTRKNKKAIKNWVTYGIGPDSRADVLQHAGLFDVNEAAALMEQRG
ncbi:hypothetical protein H2202_009885 [Exophiala xenobiotica]|nr:hypothetical protein H2202_009885 [Exophiala xenobiotica]